MDSSNTNKRKESEDGERMGEKNNNTVVAGSMMMIMIRVHAENIERALVVYGAKENGRTTWMDEWIGRSMDGYTNAAIGGSSMTAAMSHQRWKRDGSCVGNVIGNGSSSASSGRQVRCMHAWLPNSGWCRSLIHLFPSLSYPCRRRW